MLEKKDIEEYLDIQAEIKDLECRIKQRKKELVTDTVMGSDPGYPYLKHPMSIYGVQIDDELQARRRKLVAKLKEQEAGIEEFIESLPRSRERRIVRYRVIDGMSWNEVAAKMGHRYSEDGVRMIFGRVTKNI